MARTGLVSEQPGVRQAWADVEDSGTMAKASLCCMTLDLVSTWRPDFGRAVVAIRGEAERWRCTPHP